MSMTNDLEQTNIALDVVNPTANVDSMVGTANPTPELANTQGGARPVFNEVANVAAADIYGTSAQRATSVNNNNNKAKQYE